jgi:hypothetical protein
MVKVPLPRIRQQFDTTGRIRESDTRLAHCLRSAQSGESDVVPVTKTAWRHLTSLESYTCLLVGAEKRALRLAWSNVVRF